MPRKLPPLNWLRAFEASARHLSFTRAAEELNVTQAAVSQQVKALERRLGTALFLRVQNRLVLTYAGQACLPKITAGFDLIEGGIDSLHVYDSGGTLSVRTPSSFSILWLTPRLDRFHSRYPEINIHVSALGRKADSEDAKAEIEIRNGSAPWPDLECVVLMREEVFPVCAPALLDGPLRARRVEDLAQQNLLHVSGYRENWQLWLAAAGFAELKLQPGLHFDQSVTAIQAAVNGLGVVLGRSALVSGELATGRLVAPFDLRLQAEDKYWITYPPALARRPNVQAFRDWLLQEAGS